MNNNLNKSLREKEVEKKKIYIKVQIDRATTTLAASTSYVRFQNGLSKAIVSIRKPIRTFSTGGQLVAGRCLYSNEVNKAHAKDSFLPCEASALFQQVKESRDRIGVKTNGVKLVIRR